MHKSPADRRRPLPGLVLLLAIAAMALACGNLGCVTSALSMAFAMGWEIFWALALGFFLSASVEAFVSKKEMTRLLPDASPKSLALAAVLGAASSSCSYAATALARSLFRKGADFTAAMAFELASTNLVIEIGILLVVLMGWPFMAAEFLGGTLMIAFLAILFRVFLSKALVAEARDQADKGIAGKMEGHAAMDMSVTDGPLAKRMSSAEGITAVSHYFMMNWASVWKDIVVGLGISGALAMWVPNDWWASLFQLDHPQVARWTGPLIGPAVAVLSFVCSVGNVPLAAVLWNKGISFGGVASFLFADLIVLPILNIYRKYYGIKMAAFLFGTFYAAMAGASYLVDFVFGAFKWIPRERSAQVVEASVRWNYTTMLNIVFAAFSILLLIRFFRTGGPAMLRAMDAPTADQGHSSETSGLNKGDVQDSHDAVKHS